MKNVSFKGVVGYSDRFVICAEYVYFASVCGARQAVESILYGLICGSSVYFQVSGSPVSKLDTDLFNVDDNYTLVHRQSVSKNRCKIYSLSRGRAHGYIMDATCILKDIGSSIVIIGESQEEAKKRFNLALKNLPIPYLEKWQDWFMKDLEKQGLLTRLTCHNCTAYKLTIHEDTLLKVITDGIKSKLIKF